MKYGGPIVTKGVVYFALVCSFLTGCSSTGAGSAYHKVVQANENAVSIRSTFPNTPLGDGGSTLALEHCAKYRKVAPLDSRMITNNIVGTRTFKCE